MLLPTKVRIILEVLRYVPFWCLIFWNGHLHDHGRRYLMWQNILINIELYQLHTHIWRNTDLQLKPLVDVCVIIDINIRLSSWIFFVFHFVCVFSSISTTTTVQLWQISWWRHQMETFSALLALGAGNSPVTGEFPSQRPVTRSFDVFFDLRVNKRLSKQSKRWWFETSSRSLWRHCNGWYNWQLAIFLRGNSLTLF